MHTILRKSGRNGNFTHRLELITMKPHGTILVLNGTRQRGTRTHSLFILLTGTRNLRRFLTIIRTETRGSLHVSFSANNRSNLRCVRTTLNITTRRTTTGIKTRNISQRIRQARITVSGILRIFIKGIHRHSGITLRGTRTMIIVSGVRHKTATLKRRNRGARRTNISTNTRTIRSETVRLGAPVFTKGTVRLGKNSNIITQIRGLGFSNIIVYLPRPRSRVNRLLTISHRRTRTQLSARVPYKQFRARIFGRHTLAQLKITTTPMVNRLNNMYKCNLIRS